MRNNWLSKNQRFYSLSSKFQLLLLFFSGLLCSAATAQNNADLADGFPFSVNFTRGEDYRGSLQTWGIIRDNYGILLFGNTNYGVQQFDGTNWRNIATPASAPPLSFAKGTDGEIYAGTFTSFGRLMHDDAGQYQFYSLTYLLSDSVAASIQDIHHTVSFGESVFFVSDDVAYRFNAADSVITLLPAEGRFTSAVQTNTGVWLNDSKRGLGYFSNEGETWGNNIPFEPESHLLLLLNGKVAVLTSEAELWFKSYDENLANETWELRTRIPGFGGDRFRSIRVATGLLDGSIAIAGSDGVFVFDALGKRRYHFSEENILTASSSHKIYQDDEGMLWVSGQNGITGIEIGRPMRELLPVQGLPASGINTVTEFNKSVFIGTGNGIYISGSDGFELILPDDIIYDFHETPAGLIIASSNGIYLYDEFGALSTIKEGRRSNRILKSEFDKALIYAAMSDGLWAVQKLDDGGYKTHRLFPFEHTIFTIHEDQTGNVWLGTGRNGIIRLSLNREDEDLPEVTAHRIFTKADGLPSDGFNFTKQLPGDVGFITEDGFYRLSDYRNSIIKDMRFESLFGDAGGFRVWPVTPGRDGSAWVASAASKIGKATYNEETGLFDWYESEFTRMAVYRSVETIHDAKSGRVYFQSFNRIGYFDETIPHQPMPAFRSHITQITASDSLVYSGWGKSQNQIRPALDYTSNNLRFNFGLISFLPAYRNSYQYFLEGADTDWSDWNNELYVDYRNLREGTYTFHVRGRNLYYVPSETASFTFTILPPWYRSLWAYFGYGLFFIGIVLGFSKWRTQQLMARQADLEAQVIARTEEVRTKSEQLEKLDKIKSTFFSNVSHEFRTPLTLIKGPAEDLLSNENLSLSERISSYKRILENSDRLLSLINQILDLSKMESGTYILQLRRIDLRLLISKAAGWYQGLATKKGLHFTIQLPDEPFWIYADIEQVELLISNLISNAVKYTADGSISVSCIIEGETAVFVVRDTGIGIPPAEQSRVFDRYYRAKSGLLSTSGSGIGLNLVKYVGELHGLDLNLDSKEGSGTEVSVRFKNGFDHITAEYITLEDDDSILADHPELAGNRMKTQPSETGFLTDEAEALPASEDIPLILIADDNHDIRAFIRSVLGTDYRYAECSDGHQLIAKAKIEQPDLILSDVMMPGLDGFSASRILKSDSETAHIPIIMITAKGGDLNERSGLESGANDYITKPFSPSILKARVSGQLALLMRLRKFYKKQLKTQKLSESEEDDEISSDSDIPDWKNKVDAVLHDPEFTVEEMAAVLSMSRSTLHRFIKKETGVSPLEYIRDQRIERACELLSKEKGSVSEIAYSVGFSSINYFSRVFKQCKGVSPTQFVAG
ncbi:MAG: response regulator [Balneolales bacterium]|nr:response regulator [Balneolales bacterium]